MKKLPLHFPLLISGSLIILVLGAAGLFFILNPGINYSAVLASFESKLGIKKLVSSSTVEISEVGDQLRLQFNILEQDKEKALAFSNQLEVGDSWQKGISIGLDQKTLNQLEPLLPINTNVSFEGNRVILSSKSFNLLKSGMPQSQIDFATGSANFSWSAEGSRYNLVMENPVELLVYATSSGKLNLSKKINSVFPIAAKVSTIDLSISGKSLDGSIVLK